MKKNSMKMHRLKFRIHLILFSLARAQQAIDNIANSMYHGKLYIEIFELMKNIYSIYCIKMRFFRGACRRPPP